MGLTKAEREKRQIDRLAELKKYEEGLRCAGKKFIAGVDEVGRGPLAGPVVAAAAVLPADFNVLGVDDSKKLTDKKRRELSTVILDQALAYGFGIVDNDVIDRINILEATKKAMAEAVSNADVMLREKGLGEIDHVVIDALTVDEIQKPQTAIVHGDATSLSIAAASIIAKVKRDDMMIEFDRVYPGYSFAKNKGYGTKAHYDGIRGKGITPIHRKSFLKNFAAKHEKA